MKVMRWETFVKKYQPIPNPLDENAGIDGYLIETYGEELDTVRSTIVKYVWTMVDGDDGDLYLSPGYHLVNRLGYIITRIPWKEENLCVEV